MANGENPAFDELMAQMGVRRLDRGRERSGKPGKGRKGRKARGEGASAAGKPDRRVESPRASAVVPAPAPTPAPAPEAAPPAPPAVDVEALQAELLGARAALQEARDRADATEAERVRVAEQRDVLDAQRRGLQRQLQAATGDTPPPMPSVAEALTERGLMGEHEAGKLLSALVAVRRVGPLIHLLQATDGPSLRAFLEDRVVLHCGGEDCPIVPGRAIVQVPKPRCEVCAGSNIQRSVRRFIDACLLTGQRHVLVVGGSPKYHRQLRELVQHHRLRLDLVPGNVRRTARQAQSDLARADVIIVWGGTLLDHSVADLYKGGRARVLRIPHRGIGRMLELAAEAIDRPASARD